MAKLEEITAVPTHEKFRRESFCIMTARQAPPVDRELPASFSLLGDAEVGELKLQLPFRFWGRWDHNSHGAGFRFSSFCTIQPHNQSGIVKYLQQAKHIGPAIAHALWDEFAEDAVKTVREQPERAAEAIEVGRFSAQRAREAAEDLERLQVTENLTIQLLDLFDGRGFGPACVRQALALWGAKAHEILARNPYQAMQMRGVGFLKADKFYLDLGHDPARLKRQVYCLNHAVRKISDAEGHTWVEWSRVGEYLKTAVGGTDVRPMKALALAVRGQVLRFHEEHGLKCVADARRAAAEEYCCRRIVEMMAT